MTPFLWISLASLVGAVVVVQSLTIRWALKTVVQSRAEVTTTLNLVKISNQHEREARDFALRSEMARQQLDGVLAKEQREHRLLLARREAKRERKTPAITPEEDRKAPTVPERRQDRPAARTFDEHPFDPTTEAGAS